MLQCGVAERRRGLTKRLHLDTPSSEGDKVVSLTEMESEDRVREANRWLACIECVWDIIGALARLCGQSVDLVLPLFLDRAASTLRRHFYLDGSLGCISVRVYLISWGTFVCPACGFSSKLIRGRKE